MSKISCNVIQDIMPLYVDEIVSEDTKKLVEEHLKECEDCRKKWKKMRAKIIIAEIRKKTQIKAEKNCFRIKHRLINRRIAAAILGASSCVRPSGRSLYNSGASERADPV